MEEKIYTLTDEGPVEGDDKSLSEEQRIKALLNDALGIVLRHLGVDLSGDVGRQMEDMEIIVENCQEEDTPLASGFYVLQRQVKNVLPIAFIGNARTEERKIIADLVMFRGEELKIE
ncbi:MAG: hypothetical protein KBG09_04820 [Syntrophobacterales bacterium]|nr:hypothetical protein [Syntrophobacterales bacterium]